MTIPALFAVMCVMISAVVALPFVQRSRTELTQDREPSIETRPPAAATAIVVDVAANSTNMILCSWPEPDPKAVAAKRAAFEVEIRQLEVEATELGIAPIARPIADDDRAELAALMDALRVAEQSGALQREEIVRIVAEYRNGPQR